MPQFPAPPQVPPAQTPAPGTSVNPPAPVAVLTGASPNAVYEGIRAQRRVVVERLENLRDEKEEIVRQLQQGTVSDTHRAGLDQRLAQVDQQIFATSIGLAEVEGQLALAAAVPGATIDPPEPNPWLYGPPEELVMMGIFFSSLLLAPIVIAYARRIWRRSAVATVMLPPELSSRMESLERSMDTVAVEVERIGEGQRFVTQLMADRAKASALPTGRSGGPGGAPTA